MAPTRMDLWDYGRGTEQLPLSQSIDPLEIAAAAPRRASLVYTFDQVRRMFHM
jgi:hypothetical protein